MTKRNSLLATAIFLLFSFSVFGQDDLMDMLNDEVPDEAAEVMATFKAIK